VIVLDTSGLVAFVDRRDSSHLAAFSTLKRDRGIRVIPATTLCESTYLIDRNLGMVALAALIEDIQVGAYLVDCGENDFSRIRELVFRYRDLRLGFADAAVIACAERLGAPVLTFDKRHFSVVAREGRFRMLPESS
jgi:predicted nucleic acid-binding protein